MDEMITADCRAVAVAGKNENMHIWFGHFDAGGERQGAAMCGMQRVQIQVTGYAGGTADAGDAHTLIVIQTQLLHGPGPSAHYYTVATAGTPNMRQVATEIFFI
jgi:hypothetical protein